MGILQIFVAVNLFLFFAPESHACSESTVTINLEEEVPFAGAEFRGPLFGVRRDHQDGLGTCYANTARNIIVGLTNGAMTPSFLDLALQFQRDSGTLNQNVLDGGDSCQTIRSVQVPGVGICDQANSPLETGDRSAASELLFLSDSSLGAQGAMLSNLRVFFQSAGQLPTSYKRGPDYSALLTRSRELLQDFQRNPNLRFPVPVISGIALPQSHLRKLFHPAEMPDGVQDRYTAVTNRLRDEFIPLIENGTTAAVLRERAAAALAPLSEEFGVNFGNSSWNRLLDNPEALTQAQESIQYFKARAPETLSSEAGAREACTQNLATDYLGSLRNVVDYLMARNLDPMAIVDAEGRLRAFSDLVQLAIAPNCLAPANRTPLPAEISCSLVNLPRTTPRTAAEIESSRTQVITSLRDGIPVGQSFQTGSASHINTIVGHRYNPARRECEFLIRESQTGTSEWMSDQMILNRAETLTIARRR